MGSRTNEDSVPLEESSNSVKDEKGLGLETDTKETSIYCGLGSCRPSVMQFCVNMGFFSGMYSIAGLLTSSLNIYINSQISTLEKQFGFSSSVSGVLLSCNDIGFLSTTLIMSYITRRTHIPRALALSTMFFGISGILCSIPHFVINDELHFEQNTNSSIAIPAQGFTAQLCVEENTKVLNSSGLSYRVEKAGSPTEISSTARNVALGLIAIGMILQGMAKAPRYPFITTYIDDNVKRTKTALYMGTIVGIGVFGPALGFILGGVFSRMPVTLRETTMTPRDPNWIGAWWLGFMIFGGCSIFGGFPLLFFPRRMKPKEKHVAGGQEQSQKSVLYDVKGWLRAVLRLGTNPIYCLLLGANCLSVFSSIGMVAFYPKYFETQFSVPTWKANMILGGVNIIAAALGAFLGGLLTTKGKLSPMSCLKVVLGVATLSLFFNSTSFIFGCSQPNFNMGSKMLPSPQNITTSCSAGCGCNETDFFPVCGSDGVNYFSPCHAGCTSASEQGYLNCTCTSETAPPSFARPGLCETGCKMMYPYMAMGIVNGFMSLFELMPTLIVTMRSVPDVDKPFALGFSSFANTLLGFIPGPVVFGQVIDTTCLIWSRTSQKKGACRLYDIDLFRMRYNGTSIGIRSIAVLLIFVAFLLARRLKNPFYDENTTKRNSETINLDPNNDRHVTLAKE